MRISLNFSLFRVVAPVATALLAALSLGGGAARAQYPAPPDKTIPIEKQSITNPYPRGTGDAQNRGRGSSDLYWGILDANVPYSYSPLSRVSADAPYGPYPLGAKGPILEMDGWVYPRGASQNGVFNPIGNVSNQFKTSRNVYANATGASTSVAPAPVNGIAWNPVTGPSTNIQSPLPTTVPKTYYRSVAYPRPTVNAINYDAASKFTWRIEGAATLSAGQYIPGTAGLQSIYRIYVHIPNAPAEDDPANPEGRINDARYTVYYYRVLNGVPTATSQTFFVSQAGGSDTVLKNADGTDAFFPLYSSATNFAALPAQVGTGLPVAGGTPLKQGVVVDNTTEDNGATGTSPYVIADALLLEPGQDAITATPTTTPPHGGRKTVEFTAATVGTRPTQPRSFLPDLTNNDNTDGTAPNPRSTTPTGVGDYNGVANVTGNNGIVYPVAPPTGLDFINNLSNLLYTPTRADDPIYDPNNAAYDSKAALETWNPSVFFQGPTSLIDPRYNGIQVAPHIPNKPLALINDPLTGVPYVDPTTGVQLGVKQIAKASDANNHEMYAVRDTNGHIVRPVPYFSHMQVIISKDFFLPDPNSATGTSTIPVSAVYSLDWLTGAPLWRFPDSTYAPPPPGNPTAFTYNRNAFLGRDTKSGSPLRPASQTPIYEVPGLVYSDRNGNGVIEDDEVFIDGRILASVTVAPRVMVQGLVSVPTYDVTGSPDPAAANYNANYGNVNGIQDAAAGRYYTPHVATGAAGNGYDPVPVGVAYIATESGIIYAVDAYGNNDTRYVEGRNATTNAVDPTVFGTYRPGTTNVLWSFSAVNHPQQRTENRSTYFQRLQGEVPATGSFGASAPVIAYQINDNEFVSDPPMPTPGDTTVNRLTQEPRLFAGNNNGVIYAMDARALAGNVLDNTNSKIGVKKLPFHKGVQADTSYEAGDPNQYALHSSELKWWFRTLGSINTPLAVSMMRNDPTGKNLPALPTGSTQGTKGVYATSQEGHVYCLDWDGPVTRIAHDTPINWDGTAAGAATLNDDIYFHNTAPANATATADTTQGVVRPRWTYPNLYRDLGVSAAPLRASQPADYAQGTTEVAGIQLAEPSALGTIQTQPMLMDFYWQNPDDAAAKPELRSYAVVVAHDPVTRGGIPIESRVYLLDQIGDRATFLTNPRKQQFSATVTKAVSQPRDQYRPKVLLASETDATIPTGLAWTYRYQYDYYAVGANGKPLPQTAAQVQRRNSPNTDTALFSPNNPYEGVPSRRMTPTVFVGGVGEIYALDIDPETALFMRWRPTVGQMRLLTPLPPGLGQAVGSPFIYPGIEARQDLLNPVDHIFDAGNTQAPLANRRIFARIVKTVAADVSLINGITVSAGPLQNRSNPTTASATPPVTPTVPQYQTTNALGAIITVLKPTNDVPNLNPFNLDPTNPSGFDPNGLIPNLVPYGHVYNFVNQDINDPLTVRRGSLASKEAWDSPTFPVPPPNTLNPTTSTPNVAFQYPVLFATSVDGYMHMISTNIEGEDTLNNPALNAIGASNGLGDGSEALGWGYAGLSDLSNTAGHTLQYVVKGPGGANTGGAAVITNAYFRHTDPTVAGTVFDPLNPPTENPNGYVPTPGGNPNDNPNEPRPDFKPRILTGGQTAVALPLPGHTASPADYHTGKTGFPLDLNGLSFDKRYAGGYNSRNNNPNAARPIAGGYQAAQDPSGDYHVGLRLPGYSAIGDLLQAAIAANPAYAALYATQYDSNQLADGARVKFTGANPNGDLRDDDDDINPAAQNIAWVYLGGDDGSLYAFTPAVFGQGSGFGGGTPVSIIPPFDPTTGNGGSLNVDIFPAAYWYNLRNNPTRPDPAQSVAQQGGKNFYEWGETVYIAVWDALARSITDAAAAVTGVPPISLREATFVRDVDNSIQLTIKRRGASGVLIQTTLPLLRKGGAIFKYPSARLDANGNAVPVGMALYPFRLDAPSATKALTPGAQVEVTAVQTGVESFGRGPGINSGFQGGVGGDPIQQGGNNYTARFAIANPLAVQGFLTSTIGGTAGQAVPAGVQKANAGDTANGIGPFESRYDQVGNVVKNRVVSTPTTPGTDDPDRFAAQYAQALVNGNTVRRVDLNPYIGNPVNRIINPAYGRTVKDVSGGDEPLFYFPVAASAGYINHGTGGSTSIGNGRQLLRIINRSLEGRIANVRLMADDEPSDFLFRAWPGAVMNADADVPQIFGPTTIAPQLFNNGRYTPAGMDFHGVVNPLPWETAVSEAKPWNLAAPVNNSLDYPDILGRKRNTVSLIGSSGDLTISRGTLDAPIATQAVPNSATAKYPTVNQVFNQINVQNPLVAVPGAYTTALNLNIPAYQPANLVAAHSLTSTYQAASQEDDPAAANSLVVTGIEGPVQLPRRSGNVPPRLLYAYDNNGNLVNQTLAPFGYTTRMVVFVDSDGSGRLNPPQATTRNSGRSRSAPVATTATYDLKPYREFEVWAGVPVDTSMKVVESVIDTGSLPHGFGQQNGLLGYNQGGANYRPAFLPPPLYDTGVLTSAPYSAFFKKFTVQNTGNVNLWNVRASQRIEFPIAGSTPGSGNPFQYLAMKSDLVDPRFGILAQGADPNLASVPQVVTSLDPQYDLLWDNYIKSGPISGPYTAISDPSDPNPAQTSPYYRYFRKFGGMHTFHKPRVGAASPSVLSVPDMPTAQYLRPVYVLDNTGKPVLDNNGQPTLDTQPSVVTQAPALAVSIPIGTPSGTYSTAFANAPFTVFENHDTDVTYNATPFIAAGAGGGITVQPAGPLYGGRNSYHPGDPDAGVVPVRAAGGNTDTGVWRPRRFLPATPTTTAKYEYQPAANPYLTIKTTVTESGLTGQVADRALGSGASPSSIVTGVLPGIDLFPNLTLDTTTVAGQTIPRPAAALTPASWRDPVTGNLHVYYARNDVAGAYPGAPYGLYHATMQWNGAIGQWQAAASGQPVSAVPSNTGRWFTLDNAPIQTSASAVDSNSSPFVLPVTEGNNFKATLFWLNSHVTPGAGATNQIYVADVTNGTTGVPQPWMVGVDPSIQRYSPRAAYFNDAATGGNNGGYTMLFYYGGVTGKWNIFYSARQANAGSPSDATPNASARRNIERQLPLPAAIVSASDPSPVVRLVSFLDPSNGQVLTNVPAVDMYYTGISRATQTPDIYMTRYQIGYQNGRPNLVPLVLPRIYQERLANNGRDPIWQARNISWFRSLGGPVNAGRLPIIYVGNTALTNPANWKYDDATGVLYQAFDGGTPSNLTFIYVDASAGTVRFRGTLTPRGTDVVRADYEPQTYRITGDGVSNSAPFAFQDTQTLRATTTLQPSGAVIRRTTDMTAGRHWMFWQKGATAGRAATLFYAARRVGIDLRDPALGTTGITNPSDSIVLNAADANNNQTPEVSSVTVQGASVPFDVDYIHGRIYVDASLEGLPVSVVYQKVSNSGTNLTPLVQNVAAPNNLPVLRYIDELTASTSSSTSGAQVPMAGGVVNEGQAYAFLDTFNPFSLLAGNRNPSQGTGPYTAADPTLSAGRVWLFWVSSRGRQGSVQTPDPFPSGYDVFWQTLAPNFDGRSFAP